MNSTPAESRRSAGRRTSDTLLRRVVALAHLGGWQFELENAGTLDEGTLQWSDEVYRIFGYEPKAFAASNQAFFAHVHPDDADAIREAVARSLETGADYHIEHRIIRPGGEVRIVEERATIEHDEQGAAVRMIGTILDVTDRRRIEEALRGAHDAGARLLSQIVENSHDAIISTALDGVITTWNPAAERVYGWKAAEAIGRPATILAPPDREAEVMANLARAVSGEAFGVFETARLRRDGSLVDVEISTSPIYDASGMVIGVSCITRDITEQRRIAAQLHHAQRLESIGRLAGGVAHDFNNLL
ncbi:MAG TPA: PAS domain S-box protein, partial [Gemmatimonadaceae bacterium]|nr:PAS domain S-box protein [Gemmatimonadaceae bacterium]